MHDEADYPNKWKKPTDRIKDQVSQREADALEKNL
jgi:hypothetical protein